MNCWFIRHTEKVGVVDEDIERLWRENRIAIHFPGTGPVDSKSLVPEDYAKRGERTAIRKFVRLGREGGYVWAEYRKHREAKVGFVKPGTTVEFMDAKWGDRYPTFRTPGAPAILKTLQLCEGVKTIGEGKWMSLRAARPLQGTISRWPKACPRLGSIITEQAIQPAWENLSTPLQETVCSEFLRFHEIEGLPKLKWLMLPVGRTLKDVDIYGLATDGKKLFAQVTFRAKDASYEKTRKLAQYKDGDVHLIMFCSCVEQKIEDSIHFVPVETAVFKWLESNPNYASRCFSEW